MLLQGALAPHVEREPAWETGLGAGGVPTGPLPEAGRRARARLDWLVASLESTHCGRAATPACPGEPPRENLALMRR